MVERRENVTDDALLAATWLCDEGFIDDHRTGEPGDPWLAGVAKELPWAAERWPGVSAEGKHYPLGPYLPCGGGQVRVELLWVDSKARPLPPELDLILRQRGWPAQRGRLRLSL